MWYFTIETHQTRIVPSMPRELQGAGYHPYLKVPWDTLKFPSNSRRACIRIPVSRTRQERAERDERSGRLSRSILNESITSKASTIRLASSRRARTCSMTYISFIVIRTTPRHVSSKEFEDEYRIRVLKAPEAARKRRNRVILL